MEKKSKLTKKLINLFWGFIGGLPIILLLVTWLMFMFTKTSLNTDTIELSIQDFYANIRASTFGVLDFISNLNWFAYLRLSDLYKVIYNLLKILTGEVSNNNILFVYISICLSWYIITQLIHITIDFIMLLPNICKRLLRKAGGDYE